MRRRDVGLKDGPMEIAAGKGCSTPGSEVDVPVMVEDERWVAKNI